MFQSCEKRESLEPQPCYDWLHFAKSESQAGCPVWMAWLNEKSPRCREASFVIPRCYVPMMSFSRSLTIAQGVRMALSIIPSSDPSRCVQHAAIPIRFQYTSFHLPVSSSQHVPMLFRKIALARFKRVLTVLSFALVAAAISAFFIWWIYLRMITFRYSGFNFFK